MANDSESAGQRRATTPARAPMVEPPHAGVGTIINDGFDEPHQTTASGPPLDHPLEHLSKAELTKIILENPDILGSMSIGRPSSGRLLNAVQMPAGPHWEIVDPNNAWGTQETIDYLVKAIQTVNERFESSPRLSLGHISDQDGGHLRPHLSHQTGRDVDISYYYKSDGRWYKRANADNLDLERTWAFVRALIVETDVDLILIDYSIQHLLRQYAKSIGEDAEWLENIFKGGGGSTPLIRHAKGHASHMHIRFFNPIAQETARRCVPIMVEHDLIEGPTHYVTHRVRSGETLARLAKRYGTTVRAIQAANGLRSTLIQAKKQYRIPQEGVALPPSTPITIPARRLPPNRVKP